MIYERQTVTGEKRYLVRIPVDGEKKTVGTFKKKGRKDGDPQVEARAAEAEAFRLRYQRGKSAQTCDGFALRWLEQGCPKSPGRKRDYKPSTMEAYCGAIRRFSVSFEGVPLDGVGRDEAYRWAESHPSFLPYIRAMFNAARNRALVTSNPFEKLGMESSRGRADNTPLSVPELHALAQTGYDLYDDQKYGHVVQTLILVAGYTGMRQGELFALDWEQVDLTGQVVEVEASINRGQVRTTPKSGKPRPVLLLSEAVEALQTMARLNAVYFGWGQQGPVFRQRQGGRFSKNTFLSAHLLADKKPAGVWPRTRDAFGRPDLHFHELRHFAGHHFYITLGCSDAETAYQLCHQDGGRLVRERYGHGEHGALERLKRIANRPAVLADQRERRTA